MKLTPRGYLWYLHVCLDGTESREVRKREPRRADHKKVTYALSQFNT